MLSRGLEQGTCTKYKKKTDFSLYLSAKLAWHTQHQQQRRTCSKKVWIWLLRGVLKVGSLTGMSMYLTPAASEVLVRVTRH